MTKAPRGPAADHGPKKVGRKPFVDSTIAVRFSIPQLAAVDRAAGEEQRQRWIRARLTDAIAAPCDYRAIAVARELLEVVGGVEGDEIGEVVSVRFDEGLGKAVEAAADQVDMRPALWIREVVLAAAEPQTHYYATKLVKLAANLTAK
jgi:hypothetical protein